MKLQSAYRGYPLRNPSTIVRTALLSSAVLFATLAAVSTLRADTKPLQPEPAILVTPDDMGTGSLLLKSTDGGKFLEAPRLKTDIAVSVSGPVARATITQRFENPSDKWVEGIYVYPLSAGAAVDTLKMQIGNRFLEGNVKERAEARQIYERAAAAGIKASLVEQQRPNMFTNAVANIGPHETVVIQIEYQETVRLENGRFELRVPLVVGPRYIPRPGASMVSVADKSGGVAWRDPVPDAQAITPPVIDPKYGKINPVTLKVALRSGVSLAAISSLYHKASVERIDDHAATVTVDGPVPADRDFVLQWKLAAATTPQATLFRETIGAQNYYLAMVVPPSASAQARRQPRDAIFVIDNSGSMAGESMKQAKAALTQALGKLKPEDTFNVIRFDDTYDVLFRASMPASGANIAVAQKFVGRLEANGGTEILAALKAALVDPSAKDTTRLRQVIFLTDGDVGNEDDVLKEIATSLGRSRLFSVGIGSAPNTFLMQHIASQGRGTFTHIGSETEVDARMMELFARLESPVMTDLRVAAEGVDLETWPNPVPDLYAGEPVVLSTVSTATSGTVRIDGRMGKTPWSTTLDLSRAETGPGISKLWARAKIEAIESSRYAGAKEGDVDAGVLGVALDHHLVSRMTSLVAVDVKPSRPDGEAMSSHEMPTNLPNGWNFEKVFGDNPDNPSIRASVDPVALQKLALADKPVTNVDGNGVELPQTDAGTDLVVFVGLMMLLSGVMVMALAIFHRTGK